MASTKKKDLESSLKNLTIDPSATRQSIAKTSKKSAVPIADSWEDEADGDSEEEAETPTAPSQTPSAPPPTPISPSSPQSKKTTSQQENLLVSTIWESSSDISPPRTQIPSHGDRDIPEHRPEKTNAVASRMIAGALGIRAPKRTEEQRAYDRALQDAERARKERERENARMKAEEKEKAKKEIWDS